MIYSVGLHALMPADYISLDYIRPGASLQAEYKVSPLIGLTGSVGIATYSWLQSVFVNGVLYSSKKITVVQTPVLVGTKFYFNKNIYAIGQIGTSFFNQSFLETSFTYAAGVGTRIGKKFDATLRYVDVPNYATAFSNLDLRFAYNFY